MAGTSRREQMRGLLRRRDREGLTYAQLEAITGECRRNLAWWAWKLRQEDAAVEDAGVPAFVELDVRPAENAFGAGGIEVMLTSGRRVALQPGFDEETLRRAVAVLEQAC